MDKLSVSAMPTTSFIHNKHQTHTNYIVWRKQIGAVNGVLALNRTYTTMHSNVALVQQRQQCVVDCHWSTIVRSECIYTFNYNRLLELNQ